MSDTAYKIQEEELIRGDISGYLNRHETKDFAFPNLGRWMTENLLDRTTVV